jgi:peptide deformylase
MRRITFLLSSFVFVLSLLGQTPIILNFAIQQNGSQLLLDSVMVANQTAGCDTMIYYPVSVLSLNITSGIENQTGEGGSNLIVNQNYPNPFIGETNIDVYTPHNDLLVKVYDTSGKIVSEKQFNLNKSYHNFVFYPGKDSQYIVSFKCGNDEKSIKLIHSGSTKGKCRIDFKGPSDNNVIKSTKLDSFSYNQGDILSFTAYTTACNTPVDINIEDSPTSSHDYTFDYTFITDIQPDAPVSGEISATETSVTWNWSTVPGAIGYKGHIEENYEAATDLETFTSLTFETVPAGTYYDLFVWAYNDCGKSFPLHLTTSTLALPLNQDEIDLITSGPSTQAMDVMSICEQPDSIILRTLSTNVILGEDNLLQLTDRMKKTVIANGGVGIAAPQVGINRRIVWIQRWDKGSVVHPWELYFNPRIVAYSDTVALRSDGCLSVLPACETLYDIAPNSYRAKWVDVEYYLADGTFVHERITQAYTAHIFQHEIDHLEAIMYFDRQTIEEKSTKLIFGE